MNFVNGTGRTDYGSMGPLVFKTDQTVIRTVLWGCQNQVFRQSKDAFQPDLSMHPPLFFLLYWSFALLLSGDFVY